MRFFIALLCGGFSLGYASSSSLVDEPPTWTCAEWEGDRVTEVCTRFQSN